MDKHDADLLAMITLITKTLPAKISIKMLIKKFFSLYLNFLQKMSLQTLLLLPTDLKKKENLTILAEQLFLPQFQMQHPLL